MEELDELHNMWWNSICTIGSMDGVKGFFEVYKVYIQFSLAFCALHDDVSENEIVAWNQLAIVMSRFGKHQNIFEIALPP